MPWLRSTTAKTNHPFRIASFLLFAYKNIEPQQNLSLRPADAQTQWLSFFTDVVPMIFVNDNQLFRSFPLSPDVPLLITVQTHCGSIHLILHPAIFFRSTDTLDLIFSLWLVQAKSIIWIVFARLVSVDVFFTEVYVATLFLVLVSLVFSVYCMEHFVECGHVPNWQWTDLRHCLLGWN